MLESMYYHEFTGNMRKLKSKLLQTILLPLTVIGKFWVRKAMSKILKY